MATTAVTLQGFVYGEDVDGVARRSLGFRLLSPVVPEPWSAEIEALARRLQAAPYPDHWPPTGLFCSVLLADGRRLIGLARYGLVDHTASRRRGGVELVGVVAPADLDLGAALAVYEWLRRRRAVADDPRALAGDCDLAEVVAAAAAAVPPHEPAPVLPVRLGPEGVLLFAATAPSDPDHHLGLLHANAVAGWQWLPLVGVDFPLQMYARRGPLIAWTPQLTGVALQLDRRPADVPRVGGVLEPLRGRTPFLLLVLVLALTCVNLALSFATWRRHAEGAARSPSQDVDTARLSTMPDPFAQALFDALSSRGGTQEWDAARDSLLAGYEKLAQEYPGLRVEATNTKGKLAVGMVHVLAQRSAGKVQDAVQKALANKGYDPRLVQAACEAVRRQLAADGWNPP